MRGGGRSSSNSFTQKASPEMVMVMTIIICLITHREVWSQLVRKTERQGVECEMGDTLRNTVR
jgi:hypothetical protein